jgi:hypothetical protein
MVSLRLARLSFRRPLTFLACLSLHKFSPADHLAASQLPIGPLALAGYHFTTSRPLIASLSAARLSLRLPTDIVACLI